MNERMRRTTGGLEALLGAMPETHARAIWDALRAAQDLAIDKIVTGPLGAALKGELLGKDPDRPWLARAAVRGQAGAVGAHFVNEVVRLLCEAAEGYIDPRRSDGDEAKTTLAELCASPGDSEGAS